MLNSTLHEQLTDGTPVSLRHEEVPAGSDSEDEEDHSGQQVGNAEQEDEDKETDEEVIKNADGVDDPLSNTYTPLLPSNSATLATSPASHLATPPGMCATTYTPRNLATNVLSQQLAIPPHGMPEVATSPISQYPLLHALLHLLLEILQHLWSRNSLQLPQSCILQHLCQQVLQHSLLHLLQYSQLHGILHPPWDLINLQQ